MFGRHPGTTTVARNLFVAGLLTASVGASAFDGHGDPVLPNVGDVRDPLTVWSAFGADPGAPSVAVVGEYGRNPLVREVANGDDVTIEPVIEDLLGTHLLVHGSVHRRFAIAAAMPMWWAHGESGPAPGDLKVWLPVRVLDPGDEGLGFAVIPMLRAPTGGEWLGEDGFGGGLDLAVGWRRGLLVANGHAGLELARRPEDDEPGGARARAAASVGVRILPVLATHVEARASAPFEGDGGVAAEALLSLRAKPLPWLGVVAGVGHGLSEGVGAATWRAYVGFGFTPGPASRTYESLRVVDAAGRAVRGARVSSGPREVGTTDADGAVQLRGVGKAVLVEAPGFEPAVLDAGALRDGGVVVLERSPVDVRVRVQAPDPAAVAVTLTGPGEADPPEVVDGEWHWRLGPGEWEATVEAPGMAPQTWRVALDEIRSEPVVVEAVLVPAAKPGGTVVVRVRDPLGAPVEGAVVRVGDAEIGRTGPGGEVAIDAVPRGSQVVTVDTGTHLDPEPVTVRVGASEASADIEVGWLPGSVRIEAFGPDGAVTDALVLFDGPEVRPALALGPDGAELLRLRPGRWTALVSSPTLGAQERAFDVTEEPGRVRVVTVVLQPFEAGTADLAVALYDPDGAPVEGARVVVDERPVGLTSSLGSMTLLGLAPGPRVVKIEAESMRPVVRTIALSDGLYVLEEVLGWVPGTVRVSAEAPDGAPIDALVAFDGPVRTPTASLGPDGTGLFRLTPGKWEVGVSSADWGLQARPFAIPDGLTDLVRVDVVMQPPGGEGSLSVSVTDPDGAPLGGVEVLLDGETLGSTSNGGRLVAQSLAIGPRRVSLVAPGYARVDADVRIRAGAEGSWQLAWGPGALKVIVRGPDGPVDALLAVGGPRALPPLTVGEDGERIVALDPGTWSVLASSAELGAQEREVVLPDAPGLSTVEFALLPVPEGQTVLLLRVRDPDGGPIEGVEIRRGREKLGATSASGSWLSPAWAPGAVDLDLRPPPSWHPGRFEGDVPEGSHQDVAILPWRTTTVAVEVVDPDGRAVPARVWFVGPAQTAERDVGAGEIVGFDLRPGAWTAYAVASGFGASFEHVLLDPGDADRRVKLKLVPAATTITEASIDLSAPIPFDLDRAELRPDALVLVAEIARTLRERPDVRLVEVGGHTDDSGGVTYNQQLSERRAEAVRQGLVELGVEPERLVAKGYGQASPLTPNVDEASRAANRRVEFRIVEREEP